MGRSPLTLAALATSALDNLEVTAVREHTAGGDGEFDSAVLSESSGRRLLLRVPNSEMAEKKAAGEVSALAAFTPGVRSRLPFTVPRLVAETAIGEVKGRLYDYIPGIPVTVRRLKANSALGASVGSAIAALHSLSPSLLDDFSLPHETATASATEVASVVDRASATGRVPASIHDRWEEALQLDVLWEFEPRPIHGDLSEASFLTNGEQLTGVLGWSELHVGDPATDLAWCIDIAGVSFDVVEAYSSASTVPVDPSIRQRALLHRELDLARWLLHGVDTGNRTIVEDGARMLADLASDIERGAIVPLIPHLPAEAGNASEEDPNPGGTGSRSGGPGDDTSD